MAKQLVKHWKGTASSYNFLKQNNALSPWTRYVVVDEQSGNVISEYYGENVISVPAGQLLPVNDIVPDISSIPQNKNPFDRYLVGTNELGYSLVEFQPISGGTLVMTTTEFNEKYGVRVASRGYKNYIYFNNRLITYDDVDCGTF
jgi:hypothetical protein